MSDRAAAFAATLAALLVGHNVGDHLVQTDAQAHHITGKAHSWWAMAGHVGSYQLTCAAVLAAVHALTGVRPSRRRLLAGHLVSAGTHAFIDRRWPVTWLLKNTGSPNFAHPRVVITNPGVRGANGTLASGPLPLHGPYLADQALHHGALLVAALVITGGRERRAS